MASTTESSSESADDVGPWAPLRYPDFRWLWIGVVISGIGTWMQAVGAQWLYIDAPNAGAIVSALQAATTGPVLLLVLPAGVLADSFDRWWLLIVVQVYAAAIAVALALLTVLEQMSVGLLVTFTAGLGTAAAVLLPTWGAMIPDLLPRSAVHAATRLDQVSVNVGRSLGPAVAGLAIAAWGVTSVFALNALSFVVLIVILIWRRVERPERGMQRERFIPALRAGGRFVRHDPSARRVLGRLSLLIAPATVIWALLPVIAQRQLGVGPSSFGIMYATLGVGAMTGALAGARLHAWLTTNSLVVVATATSAVGLAAASAASSLTAVLAPLLLVGFGWTSSIAALMGQLQLILPDWVRARGLALAMMVFTGTQTVAAPIWGVSSDRFGISTTVLVAAALVGVSAAVGVWWPLPHAGEEDSAQASYWGPASLALVPAPSDGPIVVEVSYVVEADRQPGFLSAMQDMRRSRLRSGATSWHLYRTGEDPTAFVEHFTVASWSEHERQHDGRLTVEDQRIEAAAFAFCESTPRARHLLPPTP